ncbi:hypothetical protein H1Q59_00245 [Holosporaceae bacterium 'Namur']|nr:hypothetical protein [Holosporaceae bacterium 'Namur']
MTTSISFSSDTNIVGSAKIDNNQDQSGIVLSGKEIHSPIEFKWIISDFVWDLSSEEVAKKAGEAIDAAIERVKALRSQINIKKFIYDPAAMEIENENVVLGVPDRSASGILEGLARMKELTMQAAMGNSLDIEMGYYDEDAHVAGQDSFIGTTFSNKALNEAVSKYKNLNDDIFDTAITMDNSLNTNFEY